MSLKRVHSPLLYVNRLQLSSVSSTEFCALSINMNHIMHLKKKKKEGWFMLIYSVQLQTSVQKINMDTAGKNTSPFFLAPRLFKPYKGRPCGQHLECMWELFKWALAVVALCQAPEVARSDSPPRLCTCYALAHHIHIPVIFLLLGLPLVAYRPGGM